MKPLDRLDDDEFAAAVQRAVVALPDAPAHMVRSAIAQFRGKASIVAETAERLREFVTAVLSFDSWMQPALAGGMRSGATATRHLLFSTDGRDIDLRISPDAGAVGGLFALTGQVLGTDESGVIELAAHPAAPGLTEPRIVALDAFGEFRLDAIGQGTYDVTLRFERDAIRLPPIVVGDRPA
jgi:hypothetical protein